MSLHLRIINLRKYEHMQEVVPKAQSNIFGFLKK